MALWSLPSSSFKWDDTDCYWQTLHENIWLCLIMGIEGFTCADEEHIIHLTSCLDSMDGNLRVVSISFQQEGRTADDAVHQEVVFDEI